MMKELRCSWRRQGYLLSRGSTMTMKRMLLERATRKCRFRKRKDTVKFERLSPTYVAGRRKRKILERRAGVENRKAQFRSNLVGRSNATDYISELPDYIIHNIISSLHTREAARMSILSKRWRHAWCSFPQLDIDHRFFLQLGGDWLLKLKKHIDSVLQNFALQMVNIDKFRLCVCNDPVVKVLANNWIEGAIRRNVKELHLQVRPSKLHVAAYCLPPFVLSVTTLSVLSLRGCNLEICNNIKLPLLQKLSLKKLRLSDLMLQNLICNSPLIDDLRLIECMELKHVNISAPTELKKFHLYQCEDLISVKIAAPTLQSFLLRQTQQVMGVMAKIKLKGCISLRELVMEYPKIVNGDFLHVTEHPVMGGRIVVANYELPFLEKLVLSKGTFLSKMQISGEKLIKLAVIDVQQLDQLFICAPQLISLEYKGKDIPITLVGPTNLREVNLYVRRVNGGIKDCKYHELLRTLGKCGDFKLLTQDKSEVTIQEDMSTIFPPLTIGYNIRTIKVSTSIDYLIDGLLTARKYPSKFSLFSHKGSNLLEATYNKLNVGRKDLSCCNYFKNKCWRHYLKEVTCEWSEVKWSHEFGGDSQAPLQPNDGWLKTCFALDWEIDKQSSSAEKLDD